MFRITQQVRSERTETPDVLYFHSSFFHDSVFPLPWVVDWVKQCLTETQTEWDSQEKAGIIPQTAFPQQREEEGLYTRTVTEFIS